MKKPSNLLYIILFCLSTNKVYAQKAIEDQNLLWLRYQVKLGINPNWQLVQELEERTYWFPSRQHQFLTRTMLKRDWGKGWIIGAGFTYISQSNPQDPSEKNFYSLYELRPQLELSYKQKLSDRFELGHRYWSEFRIREQENGKLKYANNRSRYKVEITYSPLDQLKLKAFEEVFLNIGSSITYNVFDQNRLGISAQYDLLKNFAAELGYINWFQQKSSGNEFYNRHIIRLTLHHTLNLKPNNCIKRRSLGQIKRCMLVQ